MVCYQQVVREFIPIERSKVRLELGVASGASDGNELRVGALLPNHRRAQGVLKAGIAHQYFVVAPNIDHAQ